MLDSKLLIKDVEGLEKRLGLPTDFVLSILNNDDNWSFITKLHSLFETIISQLIISYVGKPKLEDELTKINFIRKISIIKKLDFLDNQTVASQHWRLKAIYLTYYKSD
jgi:hypothetical protein